MQRKSSDEKTVITLADGTEIGNSEFQVIAGSCAVESLEQMDEVGAAMAERGIRLMRGMAYKPRTSPYDFQGLGEAGLQIARQVANKHNMYIVSEIMDMSLISQMSDYTDIFWVGARNMNNGFLLKAMGQVRQPVILKRNIGALVRLLARGVDGHCFDFYVISAAPEEVVRVPPDVVYRIFGRELSMGKSMGLMGMVAMVATEARRRLAA